MNTEILEKSKSNRSGRAGKPAEHKRLKKSLAFSPSEEKAIRAELDIFNAVNETNLTLAEYMRYKVFKESEVRNIRNMLKDLMYNPNKDLEGLRKALTNINQIAKYLNEANKKAQSEVLQKMAEDAFKTASNLLIQISLHSYNDLERLKTLNDSQNN